MALKECPECGEQVSAAAKACPHCGAPPKAKQVADAIWGLGCVVLMFGLGLPFLLLLGGC